MKPALRSSRRNPGAGFTLIEIVLAIGLTIGLLFVVLFFYQQSSQIRGQILEQVEHTSAIRLFLDQFAGELQAAHNDDYLIMGLTGTSNYIEFVTATVPASAAWNTAALQPRSDLHLVRYRLDPGWEGYSLGLNRDEETLVQTILPLDPALDSDAQQKLATNVTTSSTVLIDAIHHLRLRYWSGTEWEESWSAWELPAGVEVTISHQELPEDADPAEYADSLYRRVIHLPQHQVVRLLDESAGAVEEAIP